MNILYYSVHQVLEYDEVRLFQSLGHFVVCLGVSGPHGARESFRPAITFSPPELELYRQFELFGGKFVYGDLDSTVIPAAFVELMDVVVVMHDAEFIAKFWPSLLGCPVIWRTIGQGLEVFESKLRPYRDAGLHIVRYSPIEAELPGSLGCDQLIRFYKPSHVYVGWTGVVESVLTFSQSYRARYPQDAEDYVRITHGHSAVLGGGGNVDIPGAVGMVGWERQIALYRECRAYLCASGLGVPYTLNFMEAWMTGMPVVVYAPLERQTSYFELDRLIDDGADGFVCRDIEAARAKIGELLGDLALAARIGAAGRASARRIFGEDVAREKWRSMLAGLADRPTNQPIHVAEASRTMSAVPSVFQVLSLLRPYDIDCGKQRVGGERDGGYVLADIPSVTDVLSFGVGPDVTFELEMARRGRRVFLNDHTVPGTPQQHRLFNFAKTGICGEGQSAPDLLPISAHLDRLDPGSRELLLKIDVEGEEWNVFSSMTQEQFERFDQIVMEVHWLEQLGNPAFAARAKLALENLNRQFTLFHVHGNNCAGLAIVDGLVVVNVIELSYVRTSLVRRTASRTVYPSAINRANRPEVPDHALLFYPFLPLAVDDHRVQEVMQGVTMDHLLSR